MADCSNNFQVSRIMMPDDSNIAGNVHGGTILKLIEEAGVIIATRHCNKRNEQDVEKIECFAALARVERTNFLEPMFIGEIAQIQAELRFASEKSLEVQCKVFAEDLRKGRRRHTTTAVLWYVPLMAPNRDIRQCTVVTVPPLLHLNTQQKIDGQKRYETQKKARASRRVESALDDEFSAPGHVNIVSSANRGLSNAHSVGYSQSSLIVMLHPSDCNMFGVASGGSIMKMMDNVAGIVAFRHCRCNVVTAAIESIDFHHRASTGLVMTITGRPIFSSPRSLFIEVFVDCENIVEAKTTRACTALFTFVALDERMQPKQIPELVVETDAEKLRFEEARKRYVALKESRKRKLTEGEANDVNGGNS